MENVAYIVESCIVSHVADADDLACENIERTCKHDVVVFFDSVQDRSGCGAFRNFKNSYSVGIAAVAAILAWRVRIPGSSAMLSIAARRP